MAPSRVLLSKSYLEELLLHQRLLGQGVTAGVYRVPWEDSSAVLKLLKDSCLNHNFRREMLLLEKLDGAGGAPRLLGVCYRPRALVITYRGRRTLNTIIGRTDLPDWYLASIGLQLTHCLQEVHAAGVIHNDLHAGNVLVTTPSNLTEPQVSIIDYGLAAMNYRVLNDMPESQQRQDLIDSFRSAARTCTPVDDIRCLGQLLKHIFRTMKAAPQSANEVLAMAWPGKYTRQATLEDILEKLSTMLNEEFNVQFPSPPPPPSSSSSSEGDSSLSPECSSHSPVSPGSSSSSSCNFHSPLTPASTPISPPSPSLFILDFHPISAPPKAVTPSSVCRV